jgi:predicted transcriptional regulator YdeE
MNYEIVNLEEKTVIGLNKRIDMADPKMSQEIGALWESLFNEDLYKKIENRKNEYSIGLYSNYEGSNCDVTVGLEAEIKEYDEFILKLIPKGKYAKFNVKGNMVEVVAKTWEKICNMDLNRTFTGDFEEYLNCDFENADINIYIAIK